MTRPISNLRSPFLVAALYEFCLGRAPFPANTRICSGLETRYRSRLSFQWLRHETCILVSTVGYPA